MCCSQRVELLGLQGFSISQMSSLFSPSPRVLAVAPDCE